MAITEAVARQRLQHAATRVGTGLSLDHAAVRYMTAPFPGVEYGLRLKNAGALLFMPEADLTAPDWESRLFKRFEAAKRYLESFSQVNFRLP